MLRTTSPQRSLWEAILPAEALGLPAELARVDRLLDDPVFIEPFRVHFDPIIGRPSIPIDTYLRLMFLKFRYRLGYALLCREVADSISWQRFCRIPLGGRVPHPTTLVKVTRRVGEQTVEGLNQALLARAAEDKLLRAHKVRADTTVVAANIGYPTDLGLLARAVDKLAATAKRIQAAGGASRTRVRDRRRAARRRTHQAARAMGSRTDQATQVVFEVTGQVARLAEAQLADARRIVTNARRALARGCTRPTGRLRTLVNELETTIQRSQRLLDQARTRLAGGMPDGASRLVSLHDPDARPIRKGRLGRPVEFGDKAQVLDNADGIVLDHTVMSASHPMRRCWPQPSGGSSAAPASHRGRSPPIGAMASLSSTRSWPTLAWPWSPSHAAAAPVPPAGWSSASVASVGWSSGAPAARADQLPEAPLRLGPHPDGRHRWRPHLVRPRCVRPQPGQDRRAARGQAPQGSMSAKAPAQASTTHPAGRLIASSPSVLQDQAIR